MDNNHDKGLFNRLYSHFDLPLGSMPLKGHAKQISYGDVDRHQKDFERRHRPEDLMATKPAVDTDHGDRKWKSSAAADQQEQHEEQSFCAIL